MAGFSYCRSLVGNSADQMIKGPQLAASISVAVGDALVMSNNELAKATSSTTQVDFICREAKTSGASDIVKPLLVDARLTKSFKIGITPLYNDVAAASGTTTTAVIATSGLSSNDLRYGFVYCKELNEQRVISASSATSGNQSTITVVEPFSRAIAAGDSIRVVPFGIGADPKLSDENELSVAVADKTGGPVRVLAVDLKAKQVEVVFK